MSHPYLREAEACKFGHGQYLISERSELVKKYAWAILNDEAIQTLVKYSPIISVGSGSGYNEYLLREAGADILASDLDPPAETWMPVLKQEAVEVAREHNDRAIMYCWPHFAYSWPELSLKAYRGNTVLFIGEGKGGCTGSEDFHDLLDEWDCIDNVCIPRWWGIYDSLTIYHRKGH